MDNCRSQVIDVLTRYFAAIDDKELSQELLDELFLKDAQMTRPNGMISGTQAICESQATSFARFKATHHTLTDHLVVFADEATANVRANLVAMHLWNPHAMDHNALENYFLAGGVIQVQLLHFERQWKIRQISLRNVWRTGSGFSSMAKT